MRTSFVHSLLAVFACGYLSGCASTEDGPDVAAEANSELSVGSLVGAVCSWQRDSITIRSVGEDAAKACLVGGAVGAMLTAPAGGEGAIPGCLAGARAAVADALREEALYQSVKLACKLRSGRKTNVTVRALVRCERATRPGQMCV